MSTNPSGAVAAPDRRASSGLEPRALAGLALGYVVCVALLAVEPDRAFGLPAHPLLVHLPVVLIPCLVLATVALVVRPAWRARYGLALGGLAVVALAATVLAAGAGEQLLAHERDAGGLVHEHAEAADTLRVLTFALTAAILLLLARDWRVRRGDAAGGRAVATVLAVVALVLSAGAGFFVVRTGHLGAKATWSQEGGSGDDDGGGGERGE
jgi:uncharacterized membrane protein